MTDSLEEKDSRAALFHKGQELDSSFCLSKVDTRDAHWMGNYLEGKLGNRIKLPVGINTTKCYSLNHVR